MGLFEYLFERKNPGNVGNIQKNQRPIRQVSIPILLVKLIISLVIVLGLFNIIVLQSFNFMKAIIFTVILFAYCFLSYKYVPQPDTSNVGLLGGLIDNPFRYTDDYNRTLIVLSVLMLPGRFIATTVIQTISLFKNKNKDIER